MGKLFVICGPSGAGLREIVSGCVITVTGRAFLLVGIRTIEPSLSVM